MRVNVFGLSQDLLLRHILFNIFLSDLFLILKDIDIASYTDDNSFCKIVGLFRMSSEKVFKDTLKAFDDFKNKQRKCRK